VGGKWGNNRGRLQVGERRYTTNSLQALTAGSCDKKQTPTMSAGPGGVARLL